MRDRLELHEKLCTILGSRNVYFSPPTNTEIHYPCFVYSFKELDAKFADNKHYVASGVYTITHIYREHRSRLFDKMLESFDFISLKDNFKNDGLYHDVYKLYY